MTTNGLGLIGRSDRTDPRPSRGSPDRDRTAPGCTAGVDDATVPPMSTADISGSQPMFASRNRSEVSVRMWRRAVADVERKSDCRGPGFTVGMLASRDAVSHPKADDVSSFARIVSARPALVSLVTYYPTGGSSFGTRSRGTGVGTRGTRSVCRSMPAGKRSRLPSGLRTGSLFHTRCKLGRSPRTIPGDHSALRE